LWDHGWPRGLHMALGVASGLLGCHRRLLGVAVDIEKRRGH
jgi:hypothetical protein